MTEKTGSPFYTEDFLPDDVRGGPGPREARGTSTTEGRVFTVTGGDWEDMLAEGNFGSQGDTADSEE